jgi:hypothetical protein
MSRDQQIVFLLHLHWINPVTPGPLDTYFVTNITLDFAAPRIKFRVPGHDLRPRKSWAERIADWPTSISRFDSVGLAFMFRIDADGLPSSRESTTIRRKIIRSKHTFSTYPICFWDWLTSVRGFDDVGASYARRICWRCGWSGRLIWCNRSWWSILSLEKMAFI